MSSKFADKVSSNSKYRKTVKDLNEVVITSIGNIMNLPKDQVYDKLDSLYKLNFKYHEISTEIRLSNPSPDVLIALDNTKAVIDDFRYDIKSLSQYIMNENNNAL